MPAEKKTTLKDMLAASSVPPFTNAGAYRRALELSGTQIGLRHLYADREFMDAKTVSLNELAVEMGIRPDTLERHLARLQKRGLITYSFAPAPDIHKHDRDLIVAFDGWEAADARYYRENIGDDYILYMAEFRAAVLYYNEHCVANFLARMNARDGGETCLP